VLTLAAAVDLVHAARARVLGDDTAFLPAAEDHITPRRLMAHLGIDRRRHREIVAAAHRHSDEILCDLDANSIIDEPKHAVLWAWTAGATAATVAHAGAHDETDDPLLMDWRAGREERVAAFLARDTLYHPPVARNPELAARERTACDRLVNRLLTRAARRRDQLALRATAPHAADAVAASRSRLRAV